MNVFYCAVLVGLEVITRPWLRRYLQTDQHWYQQQKEFGINWIDGCTYVKAGGQSSATVVTKYFIAAVNRLIHYNHTSTLEFA